MPVTGDGLGETEVVIPLSVELLGDLIIKYDDGRLSVHKYGEDIKVVGADDNLAVIGSNNFDILYEAGSGRVLL